MTYYSPELKDEAVKAYLADPEASEQDIAMIYGISQTTLSRALAERGHKTLSSYKTSEEHLMLTYLKAKGVISLAGLSQRI